MVDVVVVELLNESVEIEWRVVCIRTRDECGMVGVNIKGGRGAGVFIANYPECICNPITKVDRVITTCGKVDASLSKPGLYMWH